MNTVESWRFIKKSHWQFSVFRYIYTYIYFLEETVFCSDEGDDHVGGAALSVLFPRRLVCLG